MILETKRLILRPWNENDAERLYELAKDPQVGPIAGWPVHESVENSKEIIKNVLSVDENYAIILKNEGSVVGCIGLMIGEQSNIVINDNEAEIGYWIGVPYWGKGLIPEAVNELMKHAFNELSMQVLWCGYFEGNEKSKRVQEKCGFKYHHTLENRKWVRMDDIRTEHITCINKAQWIEMK